MLIFLYVVSCGFINLKNFHEILRYLFQILATPLLHHGRKHFCRYCLQAFSTEEILKRHIKACFKINGKQRIVMPEKEEYVKFKNYERETNSLFII